MKKYLQELETHFPNLGKNDKANFTKLIDEVKKWNEKINLISRKDINNLVVHHILHSLAISKVVSFQPNTSVVDVGTGGGFPGLVLAIIFPEVNFVLVDSVTKKAFATEKIAHSLSLPNVQVYNKRIENITEKFDYVVGRAVININNFVELTHKNLSANPTGTIYYLSGPSEIKSSILANFHVAATKCSNFFPNTFFEEKLIWSVRGKKDT